MSRTHKLAKDPTTAPFDKWFELLFGRINTKNSSTPRMLKVVARISKKIGDSKTKRLILGKLESSLDDIFAKRRVLEIATFQEYDQCRQALEEASRELLSDSSIDSRAELEKLKAAADADWEELESTITSLAYNVVKSLDRFGEVIRIDSLNVDQEQKRVRDNLLQKCIPEEYYKDEERYNAIFEEFRKSRKDAAVIRVITWDMEAMQGEPLRTDAYISPLGPTLGEIAELVAKELEVEIVPDIYVKRKEPSKNRVTSSQDWWERQPWDRNLADVPKQRDIGGDDTVVLEAVIRDHDNYMVTLLDNGTVECGMVVDFPPRRLNCPSIHDHVQSLLDERHVDMALEKILSLSEKSNVSSKAMHKGHFPDPCCVYIKGLLNSTGGPLEAFSQAQDITPSIQP